MRHLEISTPATRLLEAKGIPFEIFQYEFDARKKNLGLHAAAGIRIDAAFVFKTLIAEVLGDPVCAVIPVAGQLSLKKVAAFFGAKSACILPRNMLRTLTEYEAGGISPLGLENSFHVLFDIAFLKNDIVCISGGLPGVVLRLSSRDVISVSKGNISSICRA